MTTSATAADPSRVTKRVLTRLSQFSLWADRHWLLFGFLLGVAAIGGVVAGAFIFGGV